MPDDRQNPQEIPQSAGVPPSQTGARAPGAAGGLTAADANLKGLDPELLRLLPMLQKFASQPHAQVAPPPVKPPSMGQNIKEGVAGIVPFVGGAIQKTIKEQRQLQVDDVANKIETINNIMATADYVSGGDPEKRKQFLDSNPQLKALLTDKKFVKGMQKVFGTDLLNPEKQNTVFHEGIKKGMSLVQANAAMKDAHGEMTEAQKRSALAQQEAAKKQATNSEMLSKMPQRSTFPDLSKVASLEGALRRDLSADNSTLLRLISEYERERNDNRKGDQADSRIDQGQQRIDNRKKEFSERKAEFEKTLEYRKWKEHLDVDTKVKVAVMSATKPSATLQPVAVFSRTGLHQLQDAQVALKELREGGYLEGALKNKLEDYVFGKGLVDPSLPPEIRQKIGKIRAAMAYTSSAAMRAHTGRTSKEIYDDFKNTLRIGQDGDALDGAMEQTASMMQEYADVITPEAQKALREPVSRDKKAAKPKSHVITDPSNVPD